MSTSTISPKRSPWGVLSVWYILALAALASAAELGAQVRPPICPEGGGGGVTAQATCIGPTVVISPRNQDTNASSISVRVDWYSNGLGLDTSTRQITLNGSNVASSFTHYPAYSVGTVTLVSGSNNLMATICSTNGVCNSDHAFYYRDTTSPTVSITPNGGTFGSHIVSVRIDWADDRKLDGASHHITFDGQNVNDRFAYSGGLASAYSQGSINLASSSWDVHMLMATICDEAGNCSTQGATFQYDTVNPTVSISPSGGTYSSSRRSVTINWSDNLGLNASSREIRLNGVRVDTAFSYSGGGASATSSGTVTLRSGGNTLSARICDNAGRCTTREASYTYDNVNPTVSISPSGGTYSGASRSVTISWGDNIGLNGDSREIRLNGADVTSRFNYSGGGTSAISSGNITLRSGGNTLSARICDNAGRCTTREASYTYDSANPTVSISPSGGTYSSSRRSVTINWSDNLGLNASSREIRLNGVRVDTAFSYSGSGASATSSGNVTLRSGGNTLSAKICDNAGRCTTRDANYTYDSTNPTVSISPSGGTYSGSSRSVTINWSDNLGLNASSREIRLNGVRVDTAFSYSGGGTSATSSGTVTLKSGSNTLSAKICDNAGRCTTRDANYTYDSTNPTVSISPSGGTYSGSSRSVTINWGDNIGLNGGSREIKLNGTNVTSSFNYSGGGTSATSSGTVTLKSGSNTLSARICDNAGRCTTREASYTYDSTNPTVSISPDGGWFNGELRNVTIAWADNVALDPTTRQIKLNGADVTSSFNYSGGGTSATSSGTVTLQLGDNTLEARISDTSGRAATRTVTYHYNDVQSVSVSVAPVNPGPSLARDQCLSIALASATGSECGDLRTVHALPSLRTLGTARTPILVYNSAHAEPQPVVFAQVALAPGDVAPDSLRTVLVVNSGQSSSRSWTMGDGLAPGDAGLIALAAGGPYATGLLPFTLEVETWYGGNALPVDTASGEVLVVNRAQSPFGSGWWLAGLEQLEFLPGGNSILWIGGEGSARRYDPAGSGRWTAKLVTRPDTLLATADGYVRKLPAGLEVHFDHAGRHVRTRNRLGHVTRFEYTTVAGTSVLERITLPLPDASDASYHYRFHYDDSGRLNKVTAQAGDTAHVVHVDVAYHGESRRIKSITDPDGHAVSYTYAGGSSPNRITGRTDRRNTLTAFGYDPMGRVRQAVVDSAQGGLNITTTLYSLESVAGGAVVVDTARAGVLLDGPRTDVGDTTRFLLDRFGAPRRIRDALGNETVLHRSDPRFPALVSAVDYPDGYREEAVYDERGNLTHHVRVNPYGKSPAVNDTTTYEYGDSGILHDFVTRVVQPEGDWIERDYFTNGNVKWVQDNRGAPSRTTFKYRDDTGRVEEVTDPAGGAYVHDYDEDTGNLIRTQSPIGFLTLWEHDDFGRNTKVWTPIDSAGAREENALKATGLLEETFYDAMGRDTLIIRSAPASTFSPSCSECITLGVVPADEVRITKVYDEEGNLLSQTYSALSDTVDATIGHRGWRYDQAGRTVVESGAGRDSMVYDPAGNVVEQINRLNHVIEYDYDELNRMVSRRVPEVAYSKTTCGQLDEGPWCGYRFPFYPNDGSDGLVIRSDVATFEYDSRGNLLHANNRHARVSRTYYPVGAVATDTLRIRRYAPLTSDSVPYPSNAFTHYYGIGYQYDRNGRRTKIIHPSNVRVGSTDYKYHQWGGLMEVRDPLENVFTFTEDLTQRWAARTFPGGGTDTLHYDPDGRLIRRDTRTPHVGIRGDRIQFDGRGKIVYNMSVRGADSGNTYRTWYAGMGPVRATLWLGSGADVRVEEFHADALGNVHWQRSFNGAVGHDRVSEQMFEDGQIAEIMSSERAPAGLPAMETDTAWMDNFMGLRMRSGRRTYRLINGISTRDATEISSSYYAGDLKLSVFQKYDVRGEAYESGERYGIFEEYRYDALGRRVMVRSRADTLCTVSCVSAVERYVWDGDQILHELRAPGGNNDSPENSTGSPPHFGSVTYTHAGGIDKPVGIILNHTGFLIVPHANWRGLFDRGTDQAGHEIDWLRNVWQGRSVGAYLNGWRLLRPDYWIGSLATGHADQSGLLYRRNRYYDPATGQFTQEDPIGLAGGLNLYGYAAGDPVNFSDPFGLCAQSDTARVTVTVDCGDGTEGRREVLAVRVHADQLADVSSAASQLVGGTDDITPAKVARWYSLLASAGAIYSFPQKSDDGLWITTGAQTRTRFGIPTRVSLRVDVLRNLGHPLAAQVLGHEGAHMVDRSEGLGLTHEQIEAIIWRYKE